MRVVCSIAALSPALLFACSDPDSACDPTVAGTICTIAGVAGTSGYQGDAPQPALEAELSLPQDVLDAPDGSLYIADWNNHRIRRLTSDGMIEWVAGQGEIGGGIDEPANNDFNHLTSLIWDCETGQNLVVAAWHNSKVRTVNVETGEIVDACGDGRRAYFGDDGPALDATLDLPAAVACDPDRNLVVIDQANQVVRRIDRETGIISRIAGQCIIDGAPPIGPGPCAPGSEPVACSGGSGKWTCGDPESTCGSPCAPSFNGELVTALEMRMAQPFGQSAPPAGRILYDANGNLLFADTSNHLIRRLRASDNMVEIIAGTAPVDGDAKAGYSGDGGPATSALLDQPTDLALGDDGTLYFTDKNNHCIRAIAPDGTIDTVAGRCTERGFEGDGGDPKQALLKLPFGVHYANGTLYIADTGNHIIRSIVLE
jgi:hypothetical protein